MEPVKRAYTCFDDAPKLHRDIVLLSIGGNLPISQVALYLNTSMETVKSVLENPVMQDYAANIATVRLFERMKAVEKVTNMQASIANQMMERIEAGEFSNKELIAAFATLGDRNEDRTFGKKSTQIHESSTTGVRKEVLSDLKRRSAGNIIEYQANKPKQVEVVND